MKYDAPSFWGRYDHISLAMWISALVLFFLWYLVMSFIVGGFD